MIRRIEHLIDPFQSDRLDQPPDRLGAFYWRYVSQAWVLLAIALAASAAIAVVNALLFAYIGDLIDRTREASSPGAFFAENEALLVQAAVLVAVVPVLHVVYTLLTNQAVVPAFTNLIRWQTHRYVLRQSLAFYQNDFAGRIANKVMQAALALRRSVVELIDAIWFVAVFVASSLLILARLDPWLAVPMLAWLAAYGLALRLVVPAVGRRSAASSEAYSRLLGRIVDSYTNILTVKLFSHAAREDDYARAGIVEQNDRTAELMRLMTGLKILVSLLGSALLAGTAAAAFWLWSREAISVGAVAAALGLAMRISNMSHWIMFAASGISENVGVVANGLDVIARPHAVVDRPGAAELRVTRGAVRFEGIRFHYGRDLAEQEGGRGSVIENLSLSVAPGEKVGLVGRSGAGKSTLVQLLLRFHDLEGGRITIDGQDIAGVTQESLRRAIGMVTQDTSLLHRSVLNNIRYGHPGADRAAVVEAAKRAHAHDFVLGLEDGRGRRGYEAHVGERGVKLSGGQRQRIAIARVLLKNAPILILDEATSALDSEAEAAIQEQLFALMAGKTVIAIAHRLSTIAAMDRLVILDRGRIVEEGTHRELLGRGGLYADMWARQAGGFLADEAQPAG
ncbi:ATP-binding cassette, subfamily B, multidrug efflux pump [Tistlia consotensis]|uniref:ATP-binding cassette, subfamily B, multidrug efflux pump n=1 Tax=Tistlia consotensis USBA 355 TaxID=560819 RepID=A0A1Y6C9J2_9PROT|nr:ABC transporter ATP-binding protein [Tistlia consotensis]SMF41242.1 ATP-binding cassette, subfamily B, multidrug efflux pump [Tistlia consotensis USBA 355]SNR73861.1 ATP-binding cassette, subfamily B, multidrug efflux pump [Tistlia consotensis]